MIQYKDLVNVSRLKLFARYVKAYVEKKLNDVPRYDENFVVGDTVFLSSSDIELRDDTLYIRNAKVETVGEDTIITIKG